MSGENALACEAATVLEADAWLRSDPARAQAIATAGREMVLANHSVDARARQIGAALDAILRGAFYGSRWRDGRYELRPAAGAGGRASAPAG